MCTCNKGGLLDWQKDSGGKDLVPFVESYLYKVYLLSSIDCGGREKQISKSCTFVEQLPFTFLPASAAAHQVVFANTKRTTAWCLTRDDMLFQVVIVSLAFRKP